MNMRIIREPDGSISPALSALMVEWGLDPERCDVDGCDGRPAVLVDAGAIIGMCEVHYQEYKQPGAGLRPLRRPQP